MDFSTEFVAFRDRMTAGQDSAFVSKQNVQVAGRTAAVYGQTGYFVTAHGIGVQSGTSIVLLDDRKLPRLFDAAYCEEENCQEGLSPHFGACARGICFRERLFFALPLAQEEQNA